MSTSAAETAKSLSPELQELEELEGTPIPNATVQLSLPTRMDGGGMQDTTVQISKIKGNAIPGDHFFTITPIDRPEASGGKIKVDDTQEGDPHLTILDKGILENPYVLRPLVKTALTLAGVESGIVEAEPGFTNLPSSLLKKVGDTVIQASGEPIIEFDAVPSSKIGAIHDREPVALVA